MNKRYIPIIALLILLVSFASSCKKESSSSIEEKPAVTTEAISTQTGSLAPLGNLNGLTGFGVDLSNTNENETIYKVTYFDQMNNPVEGVNLQICSEEICYVFTSDANGVCECKLPASEYELHTLTVPSGYINSSADLMYASSNGCDITIVLEKK